MKRWWIGCAMLTGCMTAAGPSIGVRTSGHMSMGWEASTTVGLYGLEVGQSYAFGPPPTSTYVAARGSRQLDRWKSEHGLAALGGSFGIGGGGGAGVAPYASAGPLYWIGERRCESRSGSTHGVVLLQLGLRLVGGAGEVYFAPKVGWYEPWCAN